MELDPQMQQQFGQMFQDAPQKLDRLRDPAIRRQLALTLAQQFPSPPPNMAQQTQSGQNPFDFSGQQPPAAPGASPFGGLK